MRVSVRGLVSVTEWANNNWNLWLGFYKFNWKREKKDFFYEAIWLTRWIGWQHIFPKGKQELIENKTQRVKNIYRCVCVCVCVCVFASTDERTGNGPHPHLIMPWSQAPDGSAPSCHGGKQWWLGCSDSGRLCSRPAGQSEWCTHWTCQNSFTQLQENPFTCSQIVWLIEWWWIVMGMSDVCSRMGTLHCMRCLGMVSLSVLNCWWRQEQMYTSGTR